MQSNLTILNIPSWSLDDYQFLDFNQNKTILCPIKSNWIHFEEFLLIFIGLFSTLVLTIRIHLTEIRFRDYYALYRCHMMNISLIILFLSSLLFILNSNERMCRYEQILIQYASIILVTNVFLMSLFRMFHHYFKEKFRFILSLLTISLTLQTIITSLWIYISKKKELNYHRQTCFHRVQIDLCIHAQFPLLLSTLALPMIFIITAFNVYRFTKPFAIAQFLESIVSAIGILMSGSMWYMNLFFSTYPQMPYHYVAYVFLLTYMLPRVWISELERSRITVEEVKPLLHNEVKFRNDNCTIRFNDIDEDYNEETDIHFSRQSPQNHLNNTRSMIRTTHMSPGEIVSSILDKYDSNSNGCL